MNEQPVASAAPQPGMRLAGKTALVTGAASGIGRESAIRFAGEGASIVAADINGEGLSETEGLVRARGGNIISLKVDLTDELACRDMVTSALAQRGERIDILFNNAGAVEFGTVEDTDANLLDRMLAVNLKATYALSRYLLPSMKRNGRGSVINTASIAAYVGVAGESAYSASKGAVISLTRCMALDYAPYNIRVNCICPGLILTPMVEGSIPPEELKARVARKYPLGRMGMPAEVAMTALFLASDEASFITGVILPVDGGMSAQ